MYSDIYVGYIYIYIGYICIILPHKFRMLMDFRHKYRYSAVEGVQLVNITLDIDFISYWSQLPYV